MTEPQTSIKFLRIGDVCARVGLARSTVYQLITDGQFPAPLKLTARASAWVEHEVTAWQKAQLEKSRAGAA